MAQTSELGGTGREGVTEVGSSEFSVWNVTAEAVVTAADAWASDLDAAGVTAVAIDLTELAATADQGRVVTFVDELQSRGIPVVLHHVPADFLTALEIDGTGSRVATRCDLSASIAVLREYDEMRRQCTTDKGRRINQLRMPARALSLASLCVYARERLRAASVSDGVARELLREVYLHMGDILETAAAALGDLTLSVTVHDGRATMTILDNGPARPARVIETAGARVDRVHCFRVLDLHNALVLERDLARRSG